MEITGFPTERRVWAETKDAKTRPSERQVQFYVSRKDRQGRGGTGKNEAKKVKGGQVLWVLRPPRRGFTESEGRHRSASRQTFLGMVAPHPPPFRTRRCAGQGPPRPPLPCLVSARKSPGPYRDGKVLLGDLSARERRGGTAQRAATWAFPPTTAASARWAPQAQH